MARVDGLSLGLVLAGAAFGYAGIKGYSIPQTIQDIVTGKSPANQSQANPITGSAAAGGIISGPSPTGNAVASDALQYQGHPYCYGGSQMASTHGCPAGQWDCSSFVNWVFGHDMGMAIPGQPAGTYDGSSHGPPTMQWLAWTGVTRISKAQAQAGDIFCWQTHMGIALGPDSMISAQTPSSGTAVAQGNISGFMPGELLFVLRHREITSGPGGGRGKGKG